MILSVQIDRMGGARLRRGEGVWGKVWGLRANMRRGHAEVEFTESNNGKLVPVACNCGVDVFHDMGPSFGLRFGEGRSPPSGAVLEAPWGPPVLAARRRTDDLAGSLPGDFPLIVRQNRRGS